VRERALTHEAVDHAELPVVGNDGAHGVLLWRVVRGENLKKALGVIDVSGSRARVRTDIPRSASA
jgi:hypothetical protein